MIKLRKTKIKVKRRDLFSSKLGVILAATGSAIGLGNIWKFPYMAGQHGGGAFLLLYLIFVFTIGMPIMMTEFVAGRSTRSNPHSAFKKLTENKFFKHVGMIGILACFIILSFYGVIAGWTLEYTFRAITNSFSGKDASTLLQEFNAFTQHPIKPIFWQFLFMALTGGVVFFGIKKGIERFSKILMPILFAILIFILIKTLFLTKNGVSGTEGIMKLLDPDFSKISIRTILDALGQSFFSLSIGLGVMITYGSYIPAKNNLTNTSVQVTILDTLIAIIAGMVIFSITWVFVIHPDEGMGLTFISLPNIFDDMAGGVVWGILFFVLLALAALTSTISTLEVLISYATEELNIKRGKATIIFTLICSALGAICSLSLGQKFLQIKGKPIFDILDVFASNILLPLGGLLVCIFFGWFYNSDKIKEELSNQGELKLKFFQFFMFFIKYIIPIAILIILVYEWLGRIL